MNMNTCLAGRTVQKTHRPILCNSIQYPIPNPCTPCHQPCTEQCTLEKEHCTSNLCPSSPRPHTRYRNHTRLNLQRQIQILLLAKSDLRYCQIGYNYRNKYHRNPNQTAAYFVFVPFHTDLTTCSSCQERNSALFPMVLLWLLEVSLSW